MCEFLEHICMLINIIVCVKEAGDRRRRSSKIKSWRWLRKQGKVLVLLWFTISSTIIENRCKSICRSIGRLGRCWLMMTFLFQWHGDEIDASVLNAAMLLLSRLHVCRSWGVALRAFRVIILSCHLHAQLLILKYVHCTQLPRTNGFSSFVTHCQVNSPHTDNPRVDYRETARSLVFLLVTFYVGSLVSFLSLDHQRALKRKRILSGSLFLQMFYISWNSVRKLEITSGISNNRELNRGDLETWERKY